jgi:PhnB protein
MIQTAQTYLNFPGNTEEAFDFYRGVFGGDFAQVIRFRDMPNTMGLSGEDLDRIAHVALPLGNAGLLMGNDVVGNWAQGFVVGTNTYTHLEVESAAEAEALFSALGEGGTVEMQIARSEWAERFGSLVDRFGVRWMVSYTGDARA